MDHFSRRMLLRSLIGSAGVALLPKAAIAYKKCWQNQFQQSVCTVGIRSGQFRRVGAYQETMVWCWAAVLQMIFAWSGKQISQRSLVEQTYGDAYTTTIDPISLINSTRRSYRDSQGRSFQVRSRIFSADFGQNELNNCDIIRSLRRERPLIICNMSHMMVLIGADYNPQVSCQAANITAAWVADPYPYSNWAPDMGPGFRDLWPVELVPAPRGQLRFMAEVSVN